MIGLFGYQSGSRINQIGFYLLDSECAATKPEETEEVEEEVEEPDVTPQELPEEEESSAVGLLVTIILTAVIFLIVLAFVIYVLYQKMKKDNNKVEVLTEAEGSQPSNRALTTNAPVNYRETVDDIEEIPPSATPPDFHPQEEPGKK